MKIYFSIGSWTPKQEEKKRTKLKRKCFGKMVCIKYNRPNQRFFLFWNFWPLYQGTSKPNKKKIFWSLRRWEKSDVVTTSGNQHVSLLFQFVDIVSPLRFDVIFSLWLLWLQIIALEAIELSSLVDGEECTSTITIHSERVQCTWYDTFLHSNNFTLMNTILSISFLLIQSAHTIMYIRMGLCA